MPVIDVAAEPGFVMMHPDGPDVFVQLYADMLPSVSAPLPESVTVLVGNVIDWSVPAFAVGGILAAFTVI